MHTEPTKEHQEPESESPHRADAHAPEPAES